MLKSSVAVAVVLLLVPLASADVPDIGNATANAGAWMVSQGIELFAYSVGDKMIQLGSGNQTVNREDATSMIFQLLTFTVDPYKFPFVQDWQQVMIVFFVILTILMVIMGGAAVMINHTSLDIAHRISWLLDSSAFFDINKWLSTIFMAVVFLILGVFGIYYLFKLEYVVSAIITEKALLTTPPTIDNLIAYLVFAFVFLILSVIMAIRSIIILLMAAGALGLMALYLIPQTRQFAISAFMYFLVILFLQPALLFVAAVGLAFIKMLPIEVLPFANVIIVGLTLLMLAISVVAIFGIGLVKKIIYVGAWAAV